MVGISSTLVGGSRGKKAALNSLTLSSFDVAPLIVEVAITNDSLNPLMASTLFYTSAPPNLGGKIRHQRGLMTEDILGQSSQRNSKQGLGYGRGIPFWCVDDLT